MCFDARLASFWPQTHVFQNNLHKYIYMCVCESVCVRVRINYIFLFHFSSYRSHLVFSLAENPLSVLVVIKSLFSLLFTSSGARPEGEVETNMPVVHQHRSRASLQRIVIWPMQFVGYRQAFGFSCAPSRCRGCGIEVCQYISSF